MWKYHLDSKVIDIGRRNQQKMYRNVYKNIRSPISNKTLKEILRERADSARSWTWPSQEGQKNLAKRSPTLDSFTSSFRHCPGPGTLGWAVGWSGMRRYALRGQQTYSSCYLSSISFQLLCFSPTKPFTIPCLSILLSMSYGFLMLFFLYWNPLSSSSIPT